MKSKKSNNNNSPNMAPKKTPGFGKKNKTFGKGADGKSKNKWPHNSVIDPLNIVFHLICFDYYVKTSKM